MYKRDGDKWYNESWDFHIADRQLASAPFHSKEGQQYLEDMNAAANFAFANRRSQSYIIHRSLRPPQDTFPDPLRHT